MERGQIPDRTVDYDWQLQLGVPHSGRLNDNIMMGGGNGLYCVGDGYSKVRLWFYTLQPR